MNTTTRKRRRVADAHDVTTPHIVSAGDIEVLRYLAIYPYLTPELLGLLLGKNGKDYITRRLRLLAKLKYVKPYLPKDGRELPISWPDFYQIDELGVDELIETGHDPQQINFVYRRRNKNAFPNFIHDYAVANAVASIEIEMKDVEIIHWSDILARAGFPSTSLPCTIAHTFPNGSRETLDTYLLPDALFGIRYPSGKASFFAVELERGNVIIPTKNLKQASLLKKLLGYQDIQRSRSYKDTLDTPNLRTLFITKTSTRAETFKREAENLIGSSNQFLFSHAPMHKPQPFHGLIDRDWLRAGMEPTKLVVL